MELWYYLRMNMRNLRDGKVYGEERPPDLGKVRLG
jgi:hypothetical protein